MGSAAVQDARQGDLSVTIRPYRPEDRAACARVFFHAVREGAAEFYNEAQRNAWAPSPDPDYEDPDKLLDQWCWVAERGPQTVGFMSLDHTGYLDMAFVLPAEMGKGTARALYDTLLAKAHAESLPRLRRDPTPRRFPRRSWIPGRWSRHRPPRVDGAVPADLEATPGRSGDVVVAQRELRGLPYRLARRHRPQQCRFARRVEVVRAGR